MKDFRFKNIYSAGAVLPAGKVLTIAGFAPAGEAVEVSLAGVYGTGIADADGKFKVALPAIDDFGGPYTLEAKCKNETISAAEIYIGMVYLCSGQSNMALTMQSQEPPYAPEVLADRNLHFFRVPNQREAAGCDDVDAGWIISAANVDDLPKISAAAFAFANNVRQQLGCAVGIIDNSIGGSCIAAWISQEYLATVQGFKERVEKYEAIEGVVNFDDYVNSHIEDIVVDEAAEAPDADESSWQEMKLPGEWSLAGCDAAGVYCFRKHFTLPEAWHGKALILSLGGIDQQDVTMVNGVEVGRTGDGADMSTWNKPRRYRIAPELLVPGDNVIVVRAISRFYMVQSGGFVGPADVMFIAPEDETVPGKIALNDKWKFKMEQSFSSYGWDFQMVKCGGGHALHWLHDNLFRPVAEFPVSGVAWYQGEADSTCAKMAAIYPGMIRALRNMYRKNYNDAALPFYIVQLPGFQGEALYEKFALWAQMRDIQLRAALEDDSFVVVTTDLGEEWEIHPPDKREVGRRLSLLALSGIHGPRLVKFGKWSEKGKFYCTFSSCGTGLNSGNRELTGFVLAGADGEFFPAQAAIVGSDTVVLHSADVAEPCFAAYAYSANPKQANLFNSDGLPASPFITTGNYPGATEENRA